MNEKRLYAGLIIASISEGPEILHMCFSHMRKFMACRGRMAISCCIQWCYSIYLFIPGEHEKCPLDEEKHNTHWSHFWKPIFKLHFQISGEFFIWTVTGCWAGGEKGIKRRKQRERDEKCKTRRAAKQISILSKAYKLFPYTFYALVGVFIILI